MAVSPVQGDKKINKTTCRSKYLFIWFQIRKCYSGFVDFFFYFFFCSLNGLSFAGDEKIYLIQTKANLWPSLRAKHLQPQ